MNKEIFDKLHGYAHSLLDAYPTPTYKFDQLITCWKNELTSMGCTRIFIEDTKRGYKIVFNQDENYYTCNVDCFSHIATYQMTETHIEEITND